MKKKSKITGTKEKIISIVILIFVSTVIYAQHDFIASRNYGCDTLTVRFRFIPEDTANPPATLLWDFGNDSTSTDTTPSVLYDRPGRYTVSVTADTTVITKTDFITVNRTPPAAFLVNGRLNEPQSAFTSRFEPIDTFRGSRAYEWRVDGTLEWEDPLFIYTFPTAGTYEVRLTVRDSICVNNSWRTINISDTLVIPNVFCPNNADYNYFTILSNGQDPISIQIFARTGALVYKAKAPVIIWDGRSSSGHELPTGVYYYVIEYDIQPTKQVRTGFVHLFRD